MKNKKMIKGLIIISMICMVVLISQSDIYYSQLSNSKYISNNDLKGCQISQRYNNFTSIVDIYTSKKVDDASISILYNKDTKQVKLINNL